MVCHGKFPNQVLAYSSVLLIATTQYRIKVGSRFMHITLQDRPKKKVGSKELHLAFFLSLHPLCMTKLLKV
jgi:hypothetical protein